MTREPFPVVGEAMRKSIELAVASNITKADWKVLAAIHYAVTSWSRLEDRASLAQIADIAGIDPSSARKSVRRLNALGVIVRRSTPGRSVGSIGLPHPTGVDVTPVNSSNRVSCEPGSDGSNRGENRDSTGVVLPPPYEKTEKKEGADEAPARSGPAEGRPAPAGQGEPIDQTITNQIFARVPALRDGTVAA